jgi:capsular exopolysaccharide synthesis family protein
MAHQDHLPELARRRGAAPTAKRVQWDFAEEPAASDWVEYWHVLRRHKAAIALLLILGALAGLLFSLPQTPIYRAQTTLEVLALNENFLNIRDVDPTASGRDSGTPYYIETQVEILRSASLIQRVVKKLQPARPAELAPTKGPAGWQQALGWGGGQISGAEALRQAAASVEVRPAGQTRIVRVAVESPDPKLAAEFANTLASEYLERTLEVRWQATQGTSDWLTRQLQDLKEKLQKSEDDLQAYARDSELMFMSEEATAADENLRNLQNELARAQADRVAKQSQYEVATAAPPEALPEVLQSGALQSSALRLAELRRQMAELQATYTAGHYRVQRLQAQVQELESAMQKERVNALRKVRSDYDSALRREKLLATSYAQQTKVVADQAAKTIQYNIRKREVETNRQLYETMLQKVKEAGIASAMRASNIAVVDRAVPPGRPAKPDHLLNTGLGLLTGLLAGVVFAFARDHVDRSLRERGDAPQYLNLPELGVIPSTEADPARRLGGKRPLVLSLKRAETPVGDGEPAPPGEGERVELVTWNRKPSLLAESFRATLTSILSAGQNGNRPRVVVFTSPGPEEGKTTVVSNLGIALAEINRRVLLIDADLRRPQLHKVFDVPNSWGLSDLLREKTALADSPLEALARPTQIPELYVLPSGPGTVSISNLLYSPRLPELLERLRREFDTVLIDTPPMLQIADARVLGQLADAAILVLRAGQTTRDAALAAKDRFAEDGIPLLGTILNAWKPGAAGKHYDCQYYYYYQREQG